MDSGSKQELDNGCCAVRERLERYEPKIQRAKKRQVFPAQFDTLEHEGPHGGGAKTRPGHFSPAMWEKDLLQKLATSKKSRYGESSPGLKSRSVAE